MLLALPTLLLACGAVGPGQLPRTSPVAVMAAAAGGLAFQTVAQGASLGPGPDAPTLLVASGPGDLVLVLGAVSEQDRGPIAAVDLSTHIVLAALAGVKPSGGHEVAVRDVAIRADRWHVVVAQQAPPPGGYGRAALTSPYHIVQVSRSDVGDPPPSAWVLLDDAGQVLAVGDGP